MESTELYNFFYPFFIGDGEFSINLSIVLVP